MTNETASSTQSIQNVNPLTSSPFLLLKPFRGLCDCMCYGFFCLFGDSMILWAQTSMDCFEGKHMHDVSCSFNWKDGKKVFYSFRSSFITSYDWCIYIKIYASQAIPTVVQKFRENKEWVSWWCNYPEGRTWEWEFYSFHVKINDQKCIGKRNNHHHQCSADTRWKKVEDMNDHAHKFMGEKQKDRTHAAAHVSIRIKYMRIFSRLIENIRKEYKNEFTI